MALTRLYCIGQGARKKRAATFKAPHPVGPPPCPAFQAPAPPPAPPPPPPRLRPRPLPPAAGALGPRSSASPSLWPRDPNAKVRAAERAGGGGAWAGGRRPGLLHVHSNPSSWARPVSPLSPPVPHKGSKGCGPGLGPRWAQTRHSGVGDQSGAGARVPNSVPPDLGHVSWRPAA